MAERSYSSAWTTQLRQEADRWEQAGLITADQRKAILALYPAPAAGGRERTILIFTILGALLVGAGVILFFAANWARMPALFKVSTIMTAVVGTYAAGYHLQYRRGDYPGLGHSLIFLGSLLYGAAIWLIAQIFHLDSQFAAGFLLWGAGVLPVVYATRSVPILYLGTVALGIWTITAQTEHMSYNWFFPVIMAGAVLPLSRMAKTVLAEAGVLAGLFVWFAINLFAHGRVAVHAEEVLVGQVMLLYGATLLPLGLSRIGDQRAYLGVGGVAALAGSYMLTFGRTWSGEQNVPMLWSGSAFQVAGVAVLAAAVAGGAYLYWRRNESGRLWVLAAVLVPAVAAFLPGFMTMVPRMVVYNLLLFAGTISLIVLGVRQRIELLVNIGLAVFVVHVLTRYFDLFFAAMDKSLFFVLGGVLLLGGGWLLEKNRRRWMSEWGGEGDDR